MQGDGSSCTDSTGVHRDLNWKLVLQSSQWTNPSNAFRAKLRCYIHAGVAPSERGGLWKRLLDCDILAMKANFSYKANLDCVREQLVQLGICEYGVVQSLTVLGNLSKLEIKLTGNPGHIDPTILRQIFSDVERTYPTHPMFCADTAEGKEGHASLFRLLSVYARYNPAVGYCQGMSFIAGMLLMNMNEAEAFWCLVVLFERQKYLHGFFDKNLSRIQSFGSVFKKLLSHRFLSLTNHLNSLGLEPLMYLTPWFMCVFTNLDCWNTVLAIWDLFMLDGISTLFRVSLSLMHIMEADVLQMSSMAEILPYLQRTPKAVCAYSRLMPVVWDTTIDDWEIKSLQAIVCEEVSSSQLGKRRRKASTDSDANSLKKSKLEQTPQSFLEKVASIFTPRSTPAQCKHTRAHSHQRIMSNSPDRSRYNMRKQTLLTRHKINSPNSSPLRSFGSPHLCSSARGPRVFMLPTSPAVRRTTCLVAPQNINCSAESLHSFKVFHTPRPLRKNQKENWRHAEQHMDSPEVEMREISNQIHNTNVS